MRIYDILGREVVTLVNDKLDPGKYEVDWNGNNFSSGLYFYKMDANGFSDTKKMVLIK
ncbi:MAG: T9SS type A sorting domain-containing protein [Ignavibacteria bacterium]|nr:T9SS type A sorting domain-containing protein [Ignavibacteria bacterium]